MKSKKAFELSTTFLVGLILGLVMFSLGLVFAYKIFFGAQQFGEGALPDYFEIEAKNCVERSEKVCVPEKKKEIQTSKQELFGVIINNLYGEEKNFKIMVQYSSGFKKDGSAAEAQEAKEWTISDYNPEDIENNKYKIIKVPMLVPKNTDSGTYVFNINICSDLSESINTIKCPTSPYNALYGVTNQITIVVP